MSEITPNAQGDYVVPTYTDPRVPMPIAIAIRITECVYKCKNRSLRF